jgi:molybdopterin synthase sulfur carrier subunit
MTVHVRYYAKLREDAGGPRETIETQAATVADLWRQVALTHSFDLDASVVKAAVADEFCPWDQGLTEGCEVVFMPPVAGG